MAEDIETAKADALLKASKYIAGCLTTPDQLDKVGQIRRKVLRNKAAVDSRLKTAVQSQIDGIRSGLQELNSSQDDIGHIKKLLSEVSEIFKECEPLNTKLRKVQIAHENHTRLAKTNSHLKLIFNVPETIKTTKQLIKDGKLLQAHKNIMELESTRDDLLYEVFKISEDDENRDEKIAQSPLYMYFDEVSNLSNALLKQIMTIVDRTLSFARSKPTELVSSLRIIEREERCDQRALDQEKKTKFLPPGRPKSWKGRCIASIRKSVDRRFDSNQIELQDKDDKMWLVKHLERMREMILEDLLAVKHLVRQCFPPSYKIFKTYIVTYHEATSRTLEHFALNQNHDRPNECVTLLNWINEYDGPDLLGHEELKEFVEGFKDELDPILSYGVVESLMEIYVSTTERNIQNWLEKMCVSESQDWNQDKLPETDTEGYFQTSLPIILFQMLDQNLQVGAFIERDVKLKIVDICVKSLEDFIPTIRTAIVNFKSKYYENRASIRYFEPYMVSVANNALLIAEFSEQMKNQMRGDLGEETFGQNRVQNFDKMIKGYKELSTEVCGMLLDGVFVDLDQHLQELMTRKWSTSPVIIATVIATFEDYANDYVHLKPEAFNYLMKTAEVKVVTEYVRAILSRRIIFRNFEERKEGAAQILEEGKKLAEAFTRLAKLPDFENSPCVVLKSCAEVLRIKSTDVVSLEVSGLATTYPDFRSDHVLALLAVRGDMGRTESLQLIADLKIREVDETPPDKKNDVIFGRITPAGSVLESLESRFKK